MGTAPAKRLSVLERNQLVVAQSDGSLAREIGLLISLGQLSKAIELLNGHEFAVAEGANLNVADSWIEAHIQLGRRDIASKHPKRALADFERALTIPPTLPTEGIDVSEREPEIKYWIGTAYSASGQEAEAKAFWFKSANANQSQSQNNKSGMTIGSIRLYYQALSLRKLGKVDEASAVLRSLLTEANEALQQSPTELDFSASQDLLRTQRSSMALEHLVAALAYIGLDQRANAKRELATALEISPDDVGARSEMDNLDRTLM
jgi:tetratricopeptide (TPR) repeat protein